MYSEKNQSALRRLSQVVAQSGGRLPADITCYRTPPGMHPSLSEDDVQKSIHSLWMSEDIVAVVVCFAWISDHEQNTCNISRLFHAEHSSPTCRSQLEGHQLTYASYLSIFPMIVTVVLRPMLRRIRRLPQGIFDSATDGVHVRC
jgi:hypothetical protein